MAISKIGSKALVDCSVAAVDIEDGSITSAKLAGSIANAKLANSNVTVNGTSINLGDSGSIPAVSWQSVKTDSDSPVTLVAGNGYFMDTTSGAITATLPGSPSAGDTIAIKDYAGTFGTNNLTIGRNGNNIQGVANDSLISTNRASLILVYSDATKGWLYTVESNVADLQVVQYVTATGGTITTSGDYKIHTFTGDGCFVVSCGGNPVGSEKVDYLVVSGGGAGGGSQGGGGGGGGFRLSNFYSLPAPTTSPLASPTGLSVSTTTYPITVGGGGSAGTYNTISSPGSNSVFSTITSTGGGRGGYQQACCSGHDGGPGGSGGGANWGIESPTPNSSIGLGNTPPVSPPQGSSGGKGYAINPPGSPTTRANGGGGGAGGVGGDGGTSNHTGGSGGIGSYVSPSFAVSCAGTTGPVPSVRYFGGGGGGSGGNGPPGTLGATAPGGAGGGGSGSTWLAPGQQPGNVTAPAGSTNTGGGGGGVSNYANSGSVLGGAGGKGIVIIRYKFQN